MNMVTKEEVQAKRYKNSDKVPEAGDIVDVGNGERAVVAQLGGCMPMFHNCTFDDKFVLTDPEDCTLVTE